MNLLWMILPMLLVCVQAENETLVFVKLGEDFTLNCSLEATKLYWFMEIHSRLRGCIGWSYRSEEQHFVDSSEAKYELREKSLTVRNITADDCRLYFCARKLNGSIHFGDAFPVVLDVPTRPSNISSESNHLTSVQKPWPNELLVFGSFALNAFLFSVIVGLVLCLCLKTKTKNKKKKNCSQQVNEPAPLTNESPDPETPDTPQYEEIQLRPSTTSPPAASLPECIYYKAQLPQSSLHRH